MRRSPPAPAFASRLAAPLLAAALLAGTASLPARAEAPAFTDAQRGAIENIVRDYLVAHPEVLVEALSAYQAKQEAAAEEAQRQALATRKDEIFNDPKDPVAGNPQGDVVLVEFFDYQCGYCKTVRADLFKLLEQDGKVKLVLKDYPILGPGSVIAARAALAARAQGKYIELHNALLEHKGQLDGETIMRIAKSVGLDADRLKKDMAAPEIQKALEANLKLADALNINGTPAFIIGDEVIPGAIKLDEFKRKVAARRTGSKG